MRNNENSFSIKIRAFLVLLLLFFVYCHVNLCEAIELSQFNQIRLGSFNIEKLGKKNLYQTKNAAEILKNYDIVAIQEVMNIGTTRKNHLGTKGIEALKQIVTYLGDDWDYIISQEPNGTLGAERFKSFNTFEYYAFIFRKSKIELIKNSAHLWNEQENPMFELKSQERQFDREPFIASFRAKNGKLDFTLITIHAASPSQKWRKDEIKRLSMIYKTVQDSDTKQNDVFLLGDFNTSIDEKEWDSLKAINGMKHILTSGNKTTINKNKGKLANQYDTIWYQEEYSGEDIVIESAQVDETWKDSIEPKTIKVPCKIKNPDSRLRWIYGRFVSDHLPVTVLLWADKDNDRF